MVSCLKPWNPDAEKVFADVFGKHTLLTLYKMMTDKVFEKVAGEISTGKEANVFVAERGDGSIIILKIYRIETADFKNILPYIAGDNRFRGLQKNKKSIIFTWARKEFSNLSRLEAAGIRVPHPLAFRNNILAMEFIGDDSPAQTMKTSQLTDPEKVFRKIKTFIRKAYKEAKLVHADLSEYNVLMLNNEPVVIDCGQAVLTSHPMAEEFLERDIKNICRFFEKKGVDTEQNKMLQWVKS